MGKRKVHQQLSYDSLRIMARLFGTAFFRLRCFGREHIPVSGPALVCANHQSFIDPVLIGLAFDRRLNYLARKTLFRFAPFRWLIEHLDAIPVDQEGIGLSGIKESLKRLRANELVLVFPEGSRTATGEIGPFLAGVCILARRANVPMLPVGIDGAFDAWPITHPYPRLANLAVVIGEPISTEWIRSQTDEQLLTELDQRVRDCHRRAKTVRASDARA